MPLLDTQQGGLLNIPGLSGFQAAQNENTAQQGNLLNLLLFKQKMEQSDQEKKLQEQHAALYGAQIEKLRDDMAKQARIAGIMNGTPPQAQAPVGLSGTAANAVGAPWAASANVPQPPAPSPADGLRVKGQQLIAAGALQEGNHLLDAAKKLDAELEMKDGIWYDKRTGQVVRGGYGVNQQGFGYQTTVGPDGKVALAPMQGASQTYGTQQDIGEQAKARYDLQTVPATSPTAQPTFASRLSLLGGSAAPGAPATRVPAGMSPVVASGQAADAAQQMEVSKSYGKIYNDYQNASMSNPAKIAKFQQIGTLLDGFEGGKFSATGLEIARAANSAGLKIDARLPNKEAAQALANQVALELRSTGDGNGMPGAMSDQDRDFLKSMTPNMAQTDAGRKQIIDTRVRLMHRENEVAKMARAYRKKYGKLDDDFSGQLQEWSNRNSLFGK